MAWLIPLETISRDWPEFRELPFAALAARMRCPLIVDGRNCLDREAALDAGLEYIGIGR